MKKFNLYLLVILSFSFLINCISSPYQGLFVTNASHHTYSSQNGSMLSSAKVLKMVESCSDTNFFFYPFYYGQGTSLSELIKQSGMTKVALIDRRSVSIFTFFYHQECVQIYGE